MTPQEARQHYLQFWYLLRSLNEPFWSRVEKSKIINDIKAAVATDPNLSGLNPTEPNFLEELTDQLTELLIAREEIPERNIPSREILELAKKQRSPLTFINARERKPLLLSESVYQIMKYHGLIDANGYALIDSVRKNRPDLIKGAEDNLGRLLAHQRVRRNLSWQIYLRLENNRVPISLFLHEFQGDNEMLGIINQVAAETVTALSQGRTLNPGRIVRLLDLHLQQSSLFQTLNPAQQARLISETQTALQTAIQAYTTLPPEDGVTITQKGTNFEIQVLPHGDPAGKYDLYSLPRQPKGIAQRVHQELGLPIVSQGTENLENFISSFSQDPVGGTFHYFYYSGVNLLLPEPLKKFYWRRKKWQKKWKQWYGPTTSSEYQRQALEQLGLKAIKYVGKQAGIVTKEDHWLPMAVLGWAGEKTVTGIGEGLAFLVGKISKKTGWRVSKRIGKNRRREENLATGIAGLALDVVLLAPKLLLWFTGKLPFVKAFKGWFAQRWFGFRFALETRFPLLKYLRLGKYTLGSLIRALPHGLISGGLTSVLFPNLPAAPWIVGASDTLFWFWRYLANNEQFLSWAQGSHTTGLGKFIGKLFPQWHGYVHIPIKGPLVGYGISVLLGLPPAGQFILTAAGGGLEYLYYVGIKPRIPAFIARWITGPISRFLGAIFTGLPGGIALPQILIGLGVSPLTAYLVGIPTGIAGFWALLKFLLPALGPYSFFGWLGMGGGTLLAAKLGLGPFWSGVFQIVGYLGGSGGVYLFWSWVTGHGTYIFLSSFFSILAQTIWGSITAALTGISAAAVFSFLSAIALVLAFVGIIIIIVTGVFQITPKEIAFRRGLQDPQLPIDKVLTNVEKNTEGILSLGYKITFSYKPNVTAIPGPLTDIKVEDRFEEIPPATGQFAFGTAIGGVFNNLSQVDINPAPSVIEPCLPSAIFGSSLVWEQSDCQPLQIGPNQTQTISLQLVFREPWSASSSTFSQDKLCNALIMTAKTPDNQTLTSSLPRLCIDRDTGEVLPAAEDAVALAQQIVNVLQNCRDNGGRGELITTFDQSSLEDAVACLEKDNIPPQAINEFIRSVSMYGTLQCVGLPMMAEAATGGFLPGLSRSLAIGSAEEYWYRREELTGYSAIGSNNYNNIAPGDIMIWSNSLGGHFAMVIDVIHDPDGTIRRINIVEASSPQAGVVNARPIAVTDAGIDAPPGTLLGWLRRE